MYFCKFGVIEGVSNALLGATDFILAVANCAASDFVNSVGLSNGAAFGLILPSMFPVSEVGLYAATNALLAASAFVLAFANCSVSDFVDSVDTVDTAGSAAGLSNGAIAFVGFAAFGLILLAKTAALLFMIFFAAISAWVIVCIFFSLIAFSCWSFDILFNKVFSCALRVLYAFPSGVKYCEVMGVVLV